MSKGEDVMYRLLNKDEPIKMGDELFPTGTFYHFVPVVKEGPECGNKIIRRKIEPEVCKEDCIHYGKIGVCVFCSLDPKNSNLYKKGILNGKTAE